MSYTASSRAIIDLDAYAHNLQAVQNIVGNQTGIIAVIKADAYGHGLLPIAEKATEADAKMIGVASIDEGITLREGGIDTPILVMIQPELNALPAIIKHNLTLMISDIATAEALGDMAHRNNMIIKVHCKIDSGMGRQGFALETSADDLQYITRISPIDIEGIATHFPAADRIDDPFTYNQIKNFKQLLRQLDKQGTPYEMAHAANSAGILQYPTSNFDRVRIGLLTYGVSPTKNVTAHPRFKPVLRWETHVTQVRSLEPGTSTGYGLTYTTPEQMRAAIIPIGYADGYKHSLSNRAQVLINGVRCPIRGSVCMDQILADITQVPQTKPGDTVTLIGTDGDQTITTEELAEHAKTIPYEILTGIGPRVQRQYIGQSSPKDTTTMQRAPWPTT